MQRRAILVLGCGVSGLTCAVRLAERGHDVEIWARELPPRTTSDVAAALWYPYAVGPKERVEAWARASYVVFRELARDPSTGVLVRSGVELFPRPTAAPDLLRGLPGFREARGDELRPGYAQGYVCEAPVIEMPVYLQYLMRRFRAAGGAIRERSCPSLAAALAASPLVVNCTGLGARELAHDASMVPIRGQLVRVARNDVERFVLDDHGPRGVTYVIPRSEDCVLGGTSQPGREDLELDPLEGRAIVERCVALEPRLARAAVLSHAVGLRPGRHVVRLEIERPAAGGLVIHDYGHGGAGVTLSWGCADEVLELLQQESAAAAR